MCVLFAIMLITTLRTKPIHEICLNNIQIMGMKKYKLIMFSGCNDQHSSPETIKCLTQTQMKLFVQSFTILEEN